MKTSNLLPLKLATSNEMNRAAEALARNKYLLDKMVYEQAAMMLAGDLHGGAYGPHEPLPFLNRVLPFFQVSLSTGDSFHALVPTGQTLGCSWRWRTNVLSPEEARKLRTKLTDENSSLDDPLHRATYAWVKPLGIIAPIEGKNRVDFLRESNVDAIPAEICECTYPSPSQIQIYRVKVNSFHETWAVLDARWIQKIENPSWTLPLMQAYGVTTDAKWPEYFDSPKTVAIAFLEPHSALSSMGHPDLGDASIVDLETIKATREYQSEPLNCSAFELKDVEISPRVWIISGVGTVAGICGLVISPTSWVEIEVAFSLILGAAMAGPLVLLSHFFTTARRNRRNELHLTRELAPKLQKRASCRMIG